MNDYRPRVSDALRALVAVLVFLEVVFVIVLYFWLFA
jgi:hypothetical protein